MTIPRDTSRARTRGLGEPPATPVAGAVPDQEEEEQKRKGSTARLWRNTVGRALTGAVDEFSDTVVNVGADIRMGLQKSQNRIFQTPFDDDFVDWYEKGPENRNPLKFGDARRERWFGEKDVESIGWAEDVIQFTAGMFGAARALRAPQAAAGTVQAVKGAKYFGRIGSLDKGGFVADAMLMDPNESNVLDFLIKKAPDEQATLIQRALASDEDDLESWNRLRAGINGFFVGKIADRVIALIRYKAIANKAAKMQPGPERDALMGRASEVLAETDKIGKTATEAAGEAAEKSADEVAAREFDIVANPDGEGFVISRAGKVLDDSPVFQEAGRANAHAVALAEAMPRSSDELLFTTKTIRDSILRSAEAGDPIDVARLADGAHFNFHWLANSEGQRSWLTAVEETLQDALNLRTITNDELLDIATKNGVGERSALRAELDRGADEARKAMVTLLTGRMYIASASQYVAKLGRLVETEDMANTVNVEKLRVAIGALTEVLPGVRNLQNASGQLLQSNKVMADPKAVLAKAASKQLSDEAGDAAVEAVLQGAARRAPDSAGIFARMTAKEILGFSRRVAMTGGDDKLLARLLGVEVEAVAQGVKKESTKWDWFNRVRYNSLLSGIKTHAKNIYSNVGMVLWRPLEYGLAGVAKGDPVQVQEAFDMAAGLWKAKAEAFDAFAKATRTGVPVLDSEMTKEGVRKIAEEGGAAGTKVLGVTRTNETWLKEVLNVFPRFLMSADDGFKMLSYRAYMNIEGMKEARRLFPDEPGKWGKFASEYIDSAFDPKGGYINKEAMEFARDNTFTRQLADGSWSKEFADMIHKLPPAKLVFPFVQTPTNIFLAVGERTPGLAQYTKRIQADIAAGGRTRALAEAKIEMGKDLWTFAAGLSLSGAITGGGPRDPQLRATMRQSGWKPYSVKTPWGWFEYASMEPLGTFLGIAADALESNADLARDERASDLAEVATATALAMSANVTNKVFLQGLANFSGVLNGDQNMGTNWAAGMGSQVIPFGSLINQTNPDPIIRDAQGVLQRIMARTAWGSESIEPMRSAFGKKLMKESWVERAVLPFSISDPNDTLEKTVMQKILRDVGGLDFIAVPQTKHHGLDLRDRARYSERRNEATMGQSPYDRHMELFDTGELRAVDAEILGNGNGGKLPPLVEAMRAMVEEDGAALRKYFGMDAYQFQGWSQARPTNPDDASKVATRKYMAQQMVSLYRKAALAQVEREYPSLKADVKAVKQGRVRDTTSRDMRHLRGLTGGLPSTK
jgi:hypothetical protein